MKEITITEVLRGVTPGQLQSVGYMQIIPLLIDPELVDKRFVTPDNLRTGSVEYGTVTVENRSSSMSILMAGAGIQTKQSAQDHGVPTAKLMKGRESARINTAFCTQSTQGGMISRGAHVLSLIPWALREISTATRAITDYTKMWNSIKEFNAQLGLPQQAHLELYLKQFKDELDNFIAQFEITNNQIGAIILLNGNVMGVERAPNFEYWKAIWRPLIRECYGSLSLQFAAQNKGKKLRVPATRVPLNPKGIDTAADLYKAVKAAKAKEEETVKGIIRKFLKSKFARDVEESSDSFTVETLNNKQFIGQVIRDDDKVVYASLVTRDAWFRNQKWHEADDFKI